MLDLLRRKSSSIFVKIILGTIVVVFVFFFGSGSLNQSLKARQTAAIVNGEVITNNLVDGLFQFQTDNNPLYKQLPDEMKLQMRQSILNALIEESVLLDQAKKAGLRVSDLELATEIKQNPQFQKNGSFDLEAYNKNFRPAFQSIYGLDYETWIRRNLLRDKLDATFNNSLFFSNAYSAHQATLTETTFKFKTIIIPEEDPLDGAEATANPADIIWPLFKAGSVPQATLDKYGLKEIDTPELTLGQLNQVLSGSDDMANMELLLKLTPENPYPPQAIKVGNTYHLIKLVERKTQETSEETAKNMGDQMEQSMALQWMSAWTDELIKKASIKISE